MSAGLVSQHQLASYANPQAGQSGTASIVLGNDNTTVTGYNTHDADATIHLQSSSLASRPAASTAQQKWMTTDAGGVYIFLDDGAAWAEVNYLRNTGGTVTGSVAVTGTMAIGGVTAANFGLRVLNTNLTGAQQYGIQSQPTFSSAAVTSGMAVVVVPGTAAAAFTMSQAIGVFIDDWDKGAGSTLTTQYGLKVGNQTKGATNYAIQTGTGLVDFNDKVSVTSQNAGQLTVGYDTTNKATVTISSAGVTSFDAAGTAPRFIFSNSVQVPVTTGLLFGGTASTFVALSRSTTTLLARLADNSDYCDFQARKVSASGVILDTSAAPTVIAGQIGLGATTQTTVGSAGGASALPAQPTGYLIINVAGTNRVVPFYAAS